MTMGQAVILCLLYAAPLLSGLSDDDTCLAYTDDTGQHHTSRDCGTREYCCGNCSYRYCCNDIFQSFSDTRQDLCNRRNRITFRRGGLIFGLPCTAFIIILTIMCCVCRPGCPLYEMRMGRRTNQTGAVIDAYPEDQPTPYQGPPTAPYPGAPPPTAPYPGGPSAQAYPPPGEKSYNQPAFAPGQPAFSPQAQAPPQPSYTDPPPPYPAT